MKTLFFLFILFSGWNPSFSGEKIQLSFGTLTFTPEIASSPEHRTQGLMYRRHLPQKTGMLFDFCTPQSVQMWMKNTPIPLDMVFLDENLMILEIVPQTTPFSLTPLGSNPNVRFVLEVNATEAASLTKGQKASLSSDALPPCT